MVLDRLNRTDKTDRTYRTDGAQGGFEAASFSLSISFLGTGGPGFESMDMTRFSTFWRASVFKMVSVIFWARAMFWRISAAAAIWADGLSFMFSMSASMASTRWKFWFRRARRSKMLGVGRSGGGDSVVLVGGIIDSGPFWHGKGRLFGQVVGPKDRNSIFGLGGSVRFTKWRARNCD